MRVRFMLGPFPDWRYATKSVENSDLYKRLCPVSRGCRILTGHQTPINDKRNSASQRFLKTAASFGPDGRFECLGPYQELQSARSVRAGSITDARRAGNQLAASAAIVKITAGTTILTGSSTSTP